MTIAVCLLVVSFVLAVFGPRLLARLTGSGIAPRLGVAAWLTAMGSVLVSWAAALGAVVLDLLHNWARPGAIIDACLVTLRNIATGNAGVLVQLAMLILTVLFAAALGALALRWARSLLRARSRTHRHAQGVRMLGRSVPGLDAVLIPGREPVAYCVAGRPHTVVVSSAALAVLDQPSLAAVLSHERAHLAGRHHLLLAATRGIAAVLPRVRLFTIGAAEVATLLEMCADDRARRHHGARAVLSALLALSGGSAIPRGALGAANVATLARAERLAHPASAGQRAGARTTLGTITALVVVAPALTAVLAAHGIALCYPWTPFLA